MVPMLDLHTSLWPHTMSINKSQNAYFCFKALVLVLM